MCATQLLIQAGHLPARKGQAGPSRYTTATTGPASLNAEAVPPPVPNEPAPNPADIFDTPPDKVTVACPHCAKSYRIAPELLGRSAVCKKCSKKFTMQDNGPNLASLKDL